MQAVASTIIDSTTNILLPMLIPLDEEDKDLKSGYIVVSFKDEDEEEEEEEAEDSDIELDVNRETSCIPFNRTGEVLFITNPPFTTSTKSLPEIPNKDPD